MLPDLFGKQSESHITRDVKHSEPIKPVVVPDSVVRRFWPKVEVRGDHECWFWTGYRLRGRYGQMAGVGRGAHPLYAHRVAFNLAFGEVPAGHEVCHRCHQANCVNPAHLYAGTHLENVRHSARDGRLSVSRPSGHKVSDGDCDRIVARVRDGERQTDVAAAFGVTKSFVCQLIKGTRRQYRRSA